MDVSVRGTDRHGVGWWFVLGLTASGDAFRWIAQEGGPGQPCAGGFREVHGRWHSAGSVAVWDTDGSGHGHFNGFLKYVTLSSGKKILVLHDPDAFEGTLIQATHLPTVHGFVTPTQDQSFFLLSQHAPVNFPAGFGRPRIGGNVLNLRTGTTLIAWDAYDTRAAVPREWSYDFLVYRNGVTGEYGDAIEFFEPANPAVKYRAGLVGSTNTLTGDNTTLQLVGDAGCDGAPVVPTALRLTSFGAPIDFRVTGMLSRRVGPPTLQQPTVVQETDGNTRGAFESVRN